ncbi:MAG TPA: LEA type 2 family protein [Thermoanaerobaculia bacterium]
MRPANQIPARPRLRLRRPAALAAAAALALAAGACAVLQQAGVQRPSVDLESTRVAALSLADVDLLLGFEIDNPNSFGVRLDRLDYVLTIAGERLAEGDQRRGVEIGAGRRTTAEIPVSIAWDDLARVYRSLRGGGAADYRIDAGFWFDVPVLGAVRVPVTSDGDFPRLSLPRLSLAGLDVGRIDAGGARLDLRLELDNPNSFPLTVDDLDYALDLAGSRVARVEDAGRLTVDRGGRGSWTVPVRIDFAEAGRAVAQVLAGGGTVDYRIDGSLSMSSGDRWIEATRVPVSSSGRVSLR